MVEAIAKGLQNSYFSSLTRNSKQDDKFPLNCSNLRKESISYLIKLLCTTCHYTMKFLYVNKIPTESSEAFDFSQQ